LNYLSFNTLFDQKRYPFIWIPLVGWIFGIYQFYLYIVGGKFVHDMGIERTLMTIFLFFLLILVFVAFIVLSAAVPMIDYLFFET